MLEESNSKASVCAYTTVQVNVCPSSTTITAADDEKLNQKAILVLIERYDADIFKCWHNFFTRELRPEESPAEFSTELQRLNGSSKPSSIKLDQTWMNSAACLMFWEGVPADIPGKPAIKSQRESLWESRADIVEGCLRLAKSIVVPKPGTVATVSADQPPAKGKGIKDIGAIKAMALAKEARDELASESEENASTKKGVESARLPRCYSCGGRGHISSQCPSNHNSGNDKVILSYTVGPTAADSPCVPDRS